MTSYAPGRWAVFEHARVWRHAAVVKEYGGSVVLAVSLSAGAATARKRKDKVAATVPGPGLADLLAARMNEIERAFQAQRAGLFDWVAAQRREAVDAAHRASGECGE